MQELFGSSQQDEVQNSNIVFHRVGAPPRFSNIVLYALMANSPKDGLG
jgi:hypothetical protein